MTIKLGEEVLTEEGYPTFRITWAAEPHVVRFEVFHVSSSFLGGVIADEELRLKADVKWDGCSNMDYLTDECEAHYCGVADLNRFCSMQIWLYAKAAELLGDIGTTYPAENPEEFVLDKKPTV